MTVAQQLADGGVVLRETVPSSDVVRARFGDVDGLRALAIVAIVAFQTVRFLGLPARTPPAIAQLFGDASQGFALFLTLSAFSLAYPILAARRTDGATYLDIGRYAVKRLLRIYPAFLAVLALAFATHPLAAALHWSALANAVPAIPASSVLRNAVFLDGGFGGFADGAGNDGFTALALVARGFILLPIALFGWLRAPRITVAAAVLAAALDVLTPAHAFTLAAVLPLVLGIVAADMRVQHHRLQRFGLPLALAAAVVAFFLEPYLALMAGTVAAPDALRVDPFWSIALFGLVAAAGFSGRLEAVLGFPPLRLLGAAAYGISLVAMPVAALATRMLPERWSFGALAAATAAEEFGVGIVVWLTVDRWFAGDGLRRRAAEGPGAWLDGILANVRASRLVFAAPAPGVSGEPEPVELRVVPPPASFYAPPPRPATDVPVFSTRTGSADDLAAEILQTKARLGERSAAVLDPEPPPAPPDTDPYAKPGFYRRPPQPTASSAGRLAATAVAPRTVAAAPAAVAPPAAVATSPMPVESPSATNGRSAGLPPVDETISSPVAATPSTAEPDARADMLPTFDAGTPAATPPLDALPASTAIALEPIVTRSTGEVAPEFSASATLADLRPHAVEPRSEALPAATPAEAWSPAVEPLSTPPADDIGVEEPKLAVPLAPHVAAVDDGPAVPEPPAPASYDGESPLEMLRAAYPPIDEAPPLEPPTTPAPAIDRTPDPMAFRLSAEPPPEPSPSLFFEAATPPPQVEIDAHAPHADELVPVALGTSDLSASVADPVMSQATPDDRGASDVEPSPAPVPSAPVPSAPVPPAPVPVAPVPVAPVPTASTVASLSLVALSETAIQPARPSGVIFRPVVKASLLVRVFKHARAKFKPVAAAAPGAPAVPPVPSGRHPVAIGREASAAPAGLAESHAARPVVTTSVPARTTASAPATAAPGRTSIRMRIGPTARIPGPDGDNG